MKGTILLSFFVLIALSLSAQLTAPATVFTKEGPLTGTDHEFATHITNEGNFQLTPYWKRVNELPNAWSSAICTGQVCWDTGTSEKPFTAPVPPTANETVIVHVYDDGQTHGPGTVRLAIYDPGDSSNNNITLEFTYLSWPVGVEKPQGAEIAIYPNPATDHVLVNLGETQAERLQLVDLSGRIIEDNPIPYGYDQASIDLKRFARGTYFIRLLNKDNVLVTKTIQKN